MDRRLYFALVTAAQSLRQHVDSQSIDRLGLTSAQAGVLFYVAAHEGCLLKDLAKGLALKSSAITGLVERTERTGCVRRRESPDDGRATRLELTAKGRKQPDTLRHLNDELYRQLC